MFGRSFFEGFRSYRICRGLGSFVEGCAEFIEVVDDRFDYF